MNNDIKKWVQGKTFSWWSTESIQFKIHESLPNAWRSVGSCLGCKVSPEFWCKEVFKTTSFSWEDWWDFSPISTLCYLQLDTTRGCWAISWHAPRCEGNHLILKIELSHWSWKIAELEHYLEVSLGLDSLSLYFSGFVFPVCRLFISKDRGNV